MRWAPALVAAAVLVAGPAWAETLRIATYNAALSRSGPGVLLKELRKGDAQIDAVATVIRRVRPDVLLVNEFDYDGGAAALRAFRDLLATGPDGIDYPHLFAAPSNTGLPSGLDLDGDGAATGPGDAFGYGNYPGQYAMAVLSRHPIDADGTRTFQALRWADLPGATLPRTEGGEPFPSAEAQAAMRLSSKSHWDVAVETPAGPLRLFASHPTPPVFDGPEDLNGLRNRDEIGFWLAYLDGWAPTDDQGRQASRTDAPFVLLGDLNADPFDGDGRRAAVRALLDHPAVQDSAPRSAGGVAAAADQAGPNRRHAGPAALDTADWREDRGPGNLRVDYVLPAASLAVEDAGVFWPAPGEADHDAAAAASDHRLVWVDVVLP
ncbi:endonuclease/exonuclease/phosphatase family protein [Rhodobacteraceae bacterium 2CG4]|uniref:Endonuclease/exonuclease/phosphatase family protein n=1 Tax=Halovulum marinum TaxID=2662447 RepID=A0A6L5Z380_9RHOB|nr:endonuclease/exonuclease/phosphatase family protein [Halovulum marinum]MSU90444.1 endonuclease/exonuclease/phosphatase family protein [Halovulum marinum]